MISIEWDNLEQTVMLHVYVGKWSLDDYEAAAKRAYGMIDAVDHPVDLIIDLSQSDEPPLRITPVAIRVSEAQHPLQKRIVIIGASSLMMMMYEGGKRLVPHLLKHVYLTKTRDEARALLHTLHHPDVA